MQMRVDGRVAGVDVARAVALIGMICAHLTFPDGVLGDVLYGFPSALFAFIAGVSMVFMARRGATPTQFAVRGIILIALHAVLALIPSSIHIVLGVLGICMICLARAPQWSSRTLGLAAAGLTVAAGLVWQFDTYGLPVIGPPYPAFMWAALMIAGMLFARHMIGRPGRLAVGFIVGAALFAADIYLRWNVELPWFLSVEGHSGGVGDVVGSTGASLSICALCCLIARPWQRVLPSMGRMPLTLYCLHVPTSLVLGAGASVLGAAAVATLWLAVFPRGPVEDMVRRGVTRGTDWIERKRNEKSIDGFERGTLRVRGAGNGDGVQHLRG